MSAISLRVGLTRMVVLAVLVAVIAPVLAVGVPAIVRAGAVDPCGTGGNPVSCENSKPGDPMANWQVTGVGDTSIQGFGTSMSVNLGQTENFKVQTTASSWHIDILRLGYYGGDGARLIATNIQPSAPQPQTQPSCISTASTGLIDCGNWAVSASWTVPTTAVSGVYMAELVRNDTGGKSQIPFVVRDDASHSDVLYQTSDETWEAYNTWGGNSLYQCAGAQPPAPFASDTNPVCPPGSPQGYQGAFAVSYNRPWHTALDDGGESWLFNAEFPMIEFLEKNGYDVSYTSGSDVDANGSLLLNHKVFIVHRARRVLVGQPEGQRHQRPRPRREPGLLQRERGLLEDALGRQHRPTPARPTGRSSPTRRPTSTHRPTHRTRGPGREPGRTPASARPPTAITRRTRSRGSTSRSMPAPPISRCRPSTRPRCSGATPPWPSLAPGQSVTLGKGLGTLGYEWDVDSDNGFRPAGEIDLSSTTENANAPDQVFNDYGTNVVPATVTHHLSLYKVASGAYVFGAGTVQFTYGLASSNPAGTQPDPNMEQFTVNLFALWARNRAPSPRAWCPARPPPPPGPPPRRSPHLLRAPPSPTAPR